MRIILFGFCNTIVGTNSSSVLLNHYSHFKSCLNCVCSLPQRASYFTSTGELFCLNRRTSTMASFSFFTNAMASFNYFTNTMVSFNLTCVIQHDKCLIELYVDQRMQWLLWEQNCHKWELTNLSRKTLNTHNLSPYLDKFSKIKANSGQTVDRKLCQTSSRWPARPHYNWITWPEHYITSPVSYFVLNS